MSNTLNFQQRKQTNQRNNWAKLVKNHYNWVYKTNSENTFSLWKGQKMEKFKDKYLCCSASASISMATRHQASASILLSKPINS